MSKIITEQGKTYKIENTGGNKGDFLFRHLILNEEEHSLLTEEEFNEIIQSNNIDFVSLERKGKVNYYHIADVDKEEFIEEEGLKVTENDWIHDLGKGIYVVKQEDCIGINNLKTYVSEHFTEESTLLIVEGTYTGSYLECIYGYQHEGYCVLKEVHEKEGINDLYSMGCENFLWSF